MDGPKQTLAACREVAVQTKHLTNREAWAAIRTEFVNRGFKGRRLVQMRNATWDERHQTVDIKANPRSLPRVFRPTGCGQAIDEIVRRIEEPIRRSASK